MSQSTIFQICRDVFPWVEAVLSKDRLCLAQGHNTVTPERLEAGAPRSRVKHPTTVPLCSLAKLVNECTENIVCLFCLI